MEARVLQVDTDGLVHSCAILPPQTLRPTAPSHVFHRGMSSEMTVQVQIPRVLGDSMFVSVEPLLDAARYCSASYKSVHQHCRSSRDLPLVLGSTYAK
jgi:hypothetical protein